MNQARRCLLHAQSLTVAIPFHPGLLPGQHVRTTVGFYPKFPNYGGFLDPPYTINGQTVRGGSGWVVMSAGDFARLGLLYATGGMLISKQLGGNNLSGTGNVREDMNTADGYGRVDGKAAYFSFGKVASDFIDPTEEEVGSWIVGPVRARRESRPQSL